MGKNNQLIDLLCTFYRLTSGNRPRFLAALRYIDDNIHKMNAEELKESFHAIERGMEVHAYIVTFIVLLLYFACCI